MIMEIEEELFENTRKEVSEDEYLRAPLDTFFNKGFAKVASPFDGDDEVEMIVVNDII